MFAVGLSTGWGGGWKTGCPCVECVPSILPLGLLWFISEGPKALISRRQTTQSHPDVLQGSCVPDAF